MIKKLIWIINGITSTIKSTFKFLVTPPGYCVKCGSIRDHISYKYTEENGIKHFCSRCSNCNLIHVKKL